MKTVFLLLICAIAASCTPSKYLREYQLEVTVDSVYLFEKKRLVAIYPHGKTGTDSAIAMDNQKP
jgi:hypothetical protein